MSEYECGFVWCKTPANIPLQSSLSPRMSTTCLSHVHDSRACLTPEIHSDNKKCSFRCCNAPDTLQRSLFGCNRMQRSMALVFQRVNLGRCPGRGAGNPSGLEFWTLNSASTASWESFKSASIWRSSRLAELTECYPCEASRRDQ